MTDPSGRVLVDVRGCHSRSLTAKADSPVQHLYAVMWSELSCARREGSPPTFLLISIAELCGPLRVGQSAGSVGALVGGAMTIALSARRHTKPGSLVALDTALVLLQATLASTRVCEIWLLTESIPLTSAPGSACLQHAGLWGLARSVAQEAPSLQLRCVDAWHNLCTGTALMIALQVVNEPEVEMCGSRVRSPRLTALSYAFLGRIRLHLRARGAISNLEIRSQPPFRSEPPEPEVEIDVRAVGLNFRDVLNVLGQYPGDPGPPGGDCAGDANIELVRLHGCTGVFGIGYAPFASTARSDARLIGPQPRALAFEASCTLPTVRMMATCAKPGAEEGARKGVYKDRG